MAKMRLLCLWLCVLFSVGSQTKNHGHYALDKNNKRDNDVIMRDLNADDVTINDAAPHAVNDDEDIDLTNTGRGVTTNGYEIPRIKLEAAQNTNIPNIQYM